MESSSARMVTIKVLLMLYDAFAVNASFFIALLVRFYVNGNFSNIGIVYLPAFFIFAPYYTVCSVIVFAMFHMYDMVWRAAGLNDLRRIVIANICTIIIHIAGTLFLVKRMPITYYAIGAVIQFALVCLIRFIPRMIINEGGQEKKTKDAMSSMIVGVGDNAIILQESLRKRLDAKEKVVCMLDYSSNGGGQRLFNGIPIINGVDNMPASIRKYNIGRVYIAERPLQDELYEKISSICNEYGVEIRDFIISTERRYGSITLFELMKIANGHIKMMKSGEEIIYNDASQVLMEIPGTAIVDAIEGVDNTLKISVEVNREVTKESNAWMRRYEENNEEVTFF